MRRRTGAISRPTGLGCEGSEVSNHRNKHWRRFAETPKKYLILGRSLVYDARGWLWAATQRDRDRLSHLDVYEGTELLGTVRVRDRVIGFDVMGSVLVTLVDRPAPADAVADRGIDWYDLGRAFDSWGPGR